MKYRIHGHRHADFLFRELGEYACLWGEIEDALASISDDMIIKEFEGEARMAARKLYFRRRRVWARGEGHLEVGFRQGCA